MVRTGNGGKRHKIMFKRNMFLFAVIAAFMISISNSGLAEAKTKRKTNVKKSVVTGAAIGAAASILTGGNAKDTVGMAAVGGAVGYAVAKTPKHRAAKKRYVAPRKTKARYQRPAYKPVHRAHKPIAKAHHKKPIRHTRVKH